MAKDSSLRYSGVNALVKMGSVPGASPVSKFSVGLARNITAPPSLRELVDVTGLEDPAFVGLPGIPSQSTFEFEHVWAPNSAATPADTYADQLLDDAWASAAEYEFDIVYNNGVNTATGTFLGRVLNLEPQQVDGSTGLTRRCEIVTSTAVTWVETANP